jgi:hypothetical protein
VRDGKVVGAERYDLLSEDESTRTPPLLTSVIPRQVRRESLNREIQRGGAFPACSRKAAKRRLLSPAGDKKKLCDMAEKNASTS